MARFLLAVVLFLAPATACSDGETMTLEKDDVQFLKITPLPDEERATSIVVSGLAFHSGLAVSTHAIEQEEGATTLLVTLVPARQGLSGSFEIPVEVGPDVTVVRFGSKKAPIWHRSRAK